MEIHIKNSTIIRPSRETPKRGLRCSDLDLLIPECHSPFVFFYRRPNDSSNFFQAGILKESLSNVLVPFYPLAGRFGKDENGRLEVKCNEEGVLFSEAETNCVIDDFGDFELDRKLLQLCPTIDYTKDISSLPFLLIQVTHFKCGGASLGIMLHHMLADATSSFHFINAWAEISRGLPISIAPIFDRTLLDVDVDVPTSPTVHHLNFSPNTVAQNIPFQSNAESVSTAILKLSVERINILKQKSKENHGPHIKYSRLEILAAHLWRCACKARGLSDDQVSKLYLAINGRSRLKPTIPSGYFGNVIFSAESICLSKDIQSEPLNSTVDRLHQTIKQIDDKCIKSVLVHLKQQSDLVVPKLGFDTYKSPNFCVSQASNMAVYEANFGWGKPMYVRPAIFNAEGIAFIFPSPINDGSLSVVITLKTEHTQLFKKFFYEIFPQPQNARSRY